MSGLNGAAGIRGARKLFASVFPSFTRVTRFTSFRLAVDTRLAAGSDGFRLGTATPRTTPAFPLFVSTGRCRLETPIGAVRALFCFFLRSPDRRLTP